MNRKRTNNSNADLAGPAALSRAGSGVRNVTDGGGDMKSAMNMVK